MGRVAQAGYARAFYAVVATLVLFVGALLVDREFLPILPAIAAVPVWVALFPPRQRSNPFRRRTLLLTFVVSSQPLAGMVVFFTVA